MPFNPDNLNHPNQVSSEQDEQSRFLESLRKNTAYLSVFLPFAILKLFNPSSEKNIIPKPVSPSVQSPQEVNPATAFEFQETIVDTTFSVPDNRNKLEYASGETAYLGHPLSATISARGMEELEKKFKSANVEWENFEIDSIKINIIAEVPFSWIGASGSEDPDTLKQKILDYYKPDEDRGETNLIFLNLGPIAIYYDNVFGTVGEESGDVIFQMKDMKIIRINMDIQKIYIQVSGEAIPEKKRTTQGYKDESKEEFKKRLQKVFELIYYPDVRGVALNFALNSGPRYGGWRNGNMLKVLTMDPQYDEWAKKYGPRHAPLMWLDIATKVKYVSQPDSSGTSPDDSTGTPADTSGTTPGQNGNPEIPESYKLVAYPNPVEAGKTVNLITHIPEPGNYTLRIFNLLGQEIWRKDYFINQENTTRTFQIPTLGPDGHPLPRGIYFARFEDQNGKTTPSTTKIIISPQK